MGVVSVGALYLRAAYDIVQPTFQYSIGVAQDKVPNPLIPGRHDALIFKRKLGSLGRRGEHVPALIPGYAVPSFVDPGKDYLLNRINWLITKVSSCTCFQRRTHTITGRGAGRKLPQEYSRSTIL